MSSTSIRISFKNNNTGGNSADGFRVYRKAGADPCPVEDSGGLPLPDPSTLVYESMNVSAGQNLWVDESDLSDADTYYYRMSFFRNNGINPNYGSVSHERVDSMLIGPLSSASSSALGYPNNFPSNLSGVPYAIDEQPIIHLDPARTVRDSSIAHEDEITASTAVEYSGRGWVEMVPSNNPTWSVFDLENVLDANGAAVPCYRFESNQGKAYISTQQTGTGPYSIDADFYGGAQTMLFCDEGWTVFVLMSPVPNGKAGFTANNINTYGSWLPATGPNANGMMSDHPQGGRVFEWSSQETKFGGGTGTFLGPDLASIPADKSHLLRMNPNNSGTATNNWMSAAHPAYASMTNTSYGYASTWKGATRASGAPTGIMGTPPDFPHDPTNSNHWLSYLHLTTVRLSPIIGDTPKYQGWINGGLPGGSVAVNTNDSNSMFQAPLAAGLAQAIPHPYFVNTKWDPTSTNAANFAGNGAYAEYLLFPKALSNAQMTTIGAYLNNKYALPSPIESFTGAHG
jgi:hypothetical protein